MKRVVAIIDYGLGNIKSAEQSIKQAAYESNLEVETSITKNLNEIASSTHIILPGQGAFESCINGLKNIDPSKRSTFQEIFNMEIYNDLESKNIKNFTVAKTSKSSVTGKTTKQNEYLESLHSKQIVFGIGPAGTGKTYLAVAAAVAQLLELFRRDSDWNDGAAKAQLFTIFDALEPNDPIVLNGRRKLSSMIFA